ncbi:hypothetical protein QUF70_05855 [Desulfobacterales bacterium HSG17]|nr:hypothetical protein [Desulfobacterales bacterium HSG17]
MTKNRATIICLTIICFNLFSFSYVQAESRLILKVKNSGETIKLRWMITDRRFDYTYVLFRAPADHPGKKIEIARLNSLDFTTAKKTLADNQVALKLMFPFETAKNRKELNQSLAQNDNRMSMLMYLSALQPIVAKALGQYYEDKPPSGTKAVIYTLEVWDGKNVSYSASRGLILGTISKLPMIWNIEAHRFDWGVGLKWQGYEAYTSFNIYRSDTYDGVYKKINEAPVQVQARKNLNGTIDLAPYFYSDTTLEKGKFAFYKVQGLDFFADKGPMTVPVKGIVKIDPHPALLARPEIKAGETDIVISWKPSSDKDVIGYNIYRSQNYEDPGEKLNEHLLTSTLFKDEKVLLDLNYFYSVTAVNKGGYESLPSLNALGLAKDVTPPAMVQSLAGKVDQAIVKLMWSAVSDKDLLGYHVYRTMQPENQDWTVITKNPIDQTKFDDVLAKNLSRHPYFYRITAIDTHYNESEPSEFVKLQLPDVTPPRAPSINGSSVRDGQVALTWTYVDDYDFAGYHVYRKKSGKVMKLTQTPLRQTAFVDQNPPVGKSLAYTVIALDKTGNESQPSPAMTLFVRDYQKPKIDVFKANVDKGMVVLTIVSRDKDLAGFDVLKSKNNRDFVKINSSRIEGLRFVDENVLNGNRYFYKVILWDIAANKTISVARELKAQ